MYDLKENKQELTICFNTWDCDSIDDKQTSRVTSQASTNLLTSLETWLFTAEQGKEREPL